MVQTDSKKEKTAASLLPISPGPPVSSGKNSTGAESSTSAEIKRIKPTPHVYRVRQKNLINSSSSSFSSVSPSFSSCSASSCPSSPSPVSSMFSMLSEKTRCEHWHSALDILALKAACCNRFYACHSCHSACEEHDWLPWPADTSLDMMGLLCGACSKTFSLKQYLSGSSKCPHCDSPFNPGEEINVTDPC